MSSGTVQEDQHVLSDGQHPEQDQGVHQRKGFSQGGQLVDVEDDGGSMECPARISTRGECAGEAVSVVNRDGVREMNNEWCTVFLLNSL